MTTTPDERYKRKLKSTFWHSAQQSGHMERANIATNPGFLRLADLAVAFAGPNGHAEFGHGELARFLGAADYRAVDRAIADAVKYRLLAGGSHKRCLQIPELCRPYAGGGSAQEQDERRTRSCPTCHGVPARPALCHPNRERYTSIESGGLCDSCYRKARLSRSSTR